MFRRIRNFVSRHPKKVATVALVAVGAVAWRFARQRLERWHEEQSRKLLEQARRQQHFESMLRAADSALAALGPSVARAVCEALDSSATMLRLQQLRDSNSKGEEWRLTWAEFKELVVSRVVSLVYCQALLCVLLRVQVAVVAGQMVRQAQAERDQHDMGDDQLAACQSLVEDGVPRVCRIVAEAVSRCPAVREASLGGKLTLQGLEQLLWAVQTLLCEESALDPLRNIARLAGAQGEVAELLSSDEVWSLASSCVSRGLAHTVDYVAAFYSEPQHPEAANQKEQPEDLAPPQQIRLPLAKIIPILEGVMRRAVGPSEGPEVDFLRLLAGDEKLRTLAANVYEAFGDTDLNHNPARALF